MPLKLDSANNAIRLQTHTVLQRSLHALKLLLAAYTTCLLPPYIPYLLSFSSQNRTLKIIGPDVG